jgi:hypothetical protein
VQEIAGDSADAIRHRSIGVTRVRPHLVTGEAGEVHDVVGRRFVTGVMRGGCGNSSWERRPEAADSSPKKDLRRPLRFVTGETGRAQRDSSPGKRDAPNAIRHRKIAGGHGRTPAPST